jgi:hypothetical protein
MEKGMDQVRVPRTQLFAFRRGLPWSAGREFLVSALSLKMGLYTFRFRKRWVTGLYHGVC